jgi:hypothetical protein
MAIVLKTPVINPHFLMTFVPKTIVPTTFALTIFHTLSGYALSATLG